MGGVVGNNDKYKASEEEGAPMQQAGFFDLASLFPTKPVPPPTGGELKASSRVGAAASPENVPATAPALLGVTLLTALLFGLVIRGDDVATVSTSSVGQVVDAAVDVVMPNSLPDAVAETTAVVLSESVAGAAASAVLFAALTAVNTGRAAAVQLTTSRAQRQEETEAALQERMRLDPFQVRYRDGGKGSLLPPRDSPASSVRSVSSGSVSSSSISSSSINSSSVSDSSSSRVSVSGIVSGITATLEAKGRKVRRGGAVALLSPARKQRRELRRAERQRRKDSGDASFISEAVATSNFFLYRTALASGLPRSSRVPGAFVVATVIAQIPYQLAKAGSRTRGDQAEAQAEARAEAEDFAEAVLAGRARNPYARATEALRDAAALAVASGASKGRRRESESRSSSSSSSSPSWPPATSSTSSPSPSSVLRAVGLGTSLIGLSPTERRAQERRDLVSAGMQRALARQERNQQAWQNGGGRADSQDSSSSSIGGGSRSSSSSISGSSSSSSSIEGGGSDEGVVKIMNIDGVDVVADLIKWLEYEVLKSDFGAPHGLQSRRDSANFIDLEAIASNSLDALDRELDRAGAVGLSGLSGGGVGGGGGSSGLFDSLGFMLGGGVGELGSLGLGGLGVGAGMPSSAGLYAALFGAIAALSSQIYKDGTHAAGYGAAEAQESLKRRTFRDWVATYVKALGSSALLFGGYESLKAPLAVLALNVITGAEGACLGSTDFELCADAYSSDWIPGAFIRSLTGSSGPETVIDILESFSK